MDLSAGRKDPTPRTDARGREQRRAPRWMPAVRCRARLTTKDGAVDAAVEDVSSRGARLVVAHAVAGVNVVLPTIGDVVDLAIELGPRTLQRRARVAWIEDGETATSFGIEHEPAPGQPDETIALDPRLVRIDPALALRAPRHLALRRRLLPICEVGGEIQVACADPSDAQALEALARHFDKPLRAQQADPEALAQVLRRIYGDRAVVRENEVEDAVGLVDDLLRAAWLRRASDLHLDPEKDHVRVRLRVDGELEDLRKLPVRMQPEILSRIKVLGGMDIAEKRAPQDGRFTHVLGANERVDLRVATLPTQHGERATLRLLALDMESLTLTNLGFSGGDLATFETAIARPHGLILVCGPTGSGKTTTLYAALRRILELGPVNAIAVQDPIEYDLPGVAQVEVDAAQKVTFGSALRSILRHDPDVIQIGEIRDLETAGIAIQAALTGHLVLATLHTNSAASALTRLVDMGVERYLIAATMRLVVAQRLVRRLCPFCREAGSIGAAEAASLRRPKSVGTTSFVATGCVYCAGRGHAGRIGLFDVLGIDEEIEREITAGADEGRLVEVARARGTRDMIDDALAKIARGETTVREVLAAVVA